MSSVAVELIYRGIFQKTLAQRICRSIVLAARKEGKIGIAFSRYSDSPERNGVPAKQFAVVAADPEQLQVSMAMYQPEETDATVALDETLSGGIESWAWNGLHPINELLKDGGTLIVVSAQCPDELVREIHRRDTPYDIAVVKGEASFSGMWVFNDDNTDVRVLGALSRLCPRVVGLASVEQAIMDQWRDPSRLESARRTWESVQARRVAPGEGNPEKPFSFQLPRLAQMEEALVVRSAPRGQPFRGAMGGFESRRNPHYKRYSTRTMRPVMDFDKCTKCGQCWLLCPDGTFDVTPDGYYDVSLESCVGCGVCEDICPTKCIALVNEAALMGRASQFETWRGDKGTYQALLRNTVSESQRKAARFHGLHHWGQYQAEALAKGKA